MNKYYEVEGIENIKEHIDAVTEACKGYTTRFGSTRAFDDLIDDLNNRRMLIEIDEKYGVYFDPRRVYVHNRSYCEISACSALTYLDDKSGYKIPWKDDDRKVDAGWYFKLCFSTGAYIFGKDYEDQLPIFRSFFEELKSLGPDHVDTNNSSLYWKVGNCKRIHETFGDTLQRYHVLNKSSQGARKIEKLKKEIEALEAHEKSEKEG